MRVGSAVMGSARTVVTSSNLRFGKKCESIKGMGTGYRAGPSSESNIFVSVLMPDRDLNFLTQICKFDPFFLAQLRLCLQCFTTGSSALHKYEYPYYW